MKKVISLILSTVMLVTVTAGIDFSSYASGLTSAGTGITDADSFDPLSDGYIIGEQANQFDFFEAYDSIENIQAWANKDKSSDGVWASWQPNCDIFDVYAEKLGLTVGGKPNSSLTDYQKVAKVYYYLSLTYKGYGQASCFPYTAMIFRRGHCEVFSNTFAELCERAGVECWILDYGEVGHSWNLVKVDGKYYECDAMNGVSFLQPARATVDISEPAYSQVYSPSSEDYYDGPDDESSKTGFEQWAADHTNLATTAYSVPAETTGLANPVTTVTATSEGTVVKWDPVDNADWYEVYTTSFDGVSNYLVDSVFDVVTWNETVSVYNDGDYIYGKSTSSSEDLIFAKADTIHSIDINESGQYQCYIDTAGTTAYGTIVCVVAKNVDGKTNIVTKNGSYSATMMNAISENYITDVSTIIDKDTGTELKYSGCAAAKVNPDNYVINKAYDESSHDICNLVRVVREYTATSQGAEVYECPNCLQRKIVYTADPSYTPHTHTWNSGTVTKKATCASEGVKTYTCTQCGYTRTEPLATTGHTWTTAVTKATTSKNGSTTTKCSVCGYVQSTSTIYYPKTVTLSATSYTYSGSAKKPTVTVKDSAGKTISSSNYTVSYSNNTNVGTATVKVTFKGNYSGSISKTFTISKKALSSSNATATLSTTTYTYNGNVRTPSVTVKYGSKKLVKGTDYTVTYSSGRKNVGKYNVKITFKGNYSGTITKTFTIKPKNTSISSVSAKSKGFTVKWKKYTTQTTGYQIQYSTSSKFTSSTTKTVTISKNSTTSKTISKLKSKKKYYVRIRTYKTVSGTKYYSSWSGAKSVTTKK